MSSPKYDALQMAPFPVDPSYEMPEDISIKKLWEETDPSAWIKAHGADVPILIAHAFVTVDKALIESLPALKLVSNLGVGVDRIDLAYCKAKGIRVGHTPDVLSNDVADMSLALLLALLRDIPKGERIVRDGQWGKTAFPLSQSLRGKAIGLYGMGSIGQEIARLCGAFGCEITYYSRSQKTHLPYGFAQSLSELARSSDILIAIVPSTDHTRHSVNADILSALGPSGYFVNIARGDIAKEADLLAALQSGAIAGAALDVYENEPNINPAFFDLENVVLAPHRGSATVQSRAAMADLTYENARRFLAGKPLAAEYKL